MKQDWDMENGGHGKAAANLVVVHKNKLIGVAVGFCFIWWMLSRSGDVLTGFSSTQQVKGWQLQVALAGFCASSLPAKLMQNTKTEVSQDGSVPRGDFEKTGDMEESEYSKASIYSLFYAAYADAGKVPSDRGVEYEFTFNTWGVAPSPYPLDDPQRYGKAAYAGLASMEAVGAYQREQGVKKLKIVEIGSGTGAGAHLISSEVLRGSQYLAIDMQLAGTNTCRRKHAFEPGNGHGSGNLTCVHAPLGVGPPPLGQGSFAIDQNGVKLADASVDVVIICETHVAAERIGAEEEAIFAEIYRILKPKGLFLWGNALPTRVWLVAPAHLSAQGFELVTSENVTKGAVTARDLDAPRVNAFVEALRKRYTVFRHISPNATCARAMELLIKNFYRHPGTALYYTMVNGFDSYYRMAFRKGVRQNLW